MLRLILILPLVGICGQVAFAQTSNPLKYRQWEVTGFAGGSFMAGPSESSTLVSDNGQVSSRTVGTRYASGHQIGVRVGENLGDYWTANLEYSLANQPLTFTNLSPSIPSLWLDVSIHRFSFGFSYSPVSRSSKRFRPYAQIGTGAGLFFIHSYSKDAALTHGLTLQDTWKFLVNWGGGAKYLVHNQVVLTLDVKDHITGLPDYGLPQSARVVNGQFQPGVARRGTLNNWQLNFGIAYQWDPYDP